MKDVLFIVPPFGSIQLPSLAAHTLQAVSRKAGYSFDVDYSNIDFFNFIGKIYDEICITNYFLIGERVFAKAAWGDDVDNQFTGNIYDYREIYERDVNPLRYYPGDRELTKDEFLSAEISAIEWVETYFNSLNVSDYKYIGVSSSFEQTNASIAILKRAKELNPQIITFIGGFNCEGVMSEGIKSLDPNSEFLDYIFSGESENTLINFLNNGSESRIITGTPVTNMDDIPNLDYSDFFTNFKDRTGMSISFETSRGCWWGQKCQCRFCGTSDRINFREKSTKRILEEIKGAEKWGVDKMHISDLIMPEKHLTELLPELIKMDKKWKFFFEQKVSLNRDEMELLKEAGVVDIQPGIESLSTDLLSKMTKGTSLKQNLIFLRDATALGLDLFWNVLWGIPGETVGEYKKINELLPLITHLFPPMTLIHMAMYRFSPYFNNPEKYSITDIEPIKSYNRVYPKWANIDKLAIMFTCNYPRETLENPEEIDKLMDSIGTWRDLWESEITKPRLFMCRQGDGSIVLLDTRGIDGCEIKRELTDDEICILISDGLYTGSPLQDWVLKIKAGIIDKGSFIPLVTVSKDIRSEYETKIRS